MSIHYYVGICVSLYSFIGLCMIIHNEKLDFSINIVFNKSLKQLSNKKIKKNKLELSSAKLRRFIKLSWQQFGEMIFDSLEAILKDSLSGFIEYMK